MSVILLLIACAIFSHEIRANPINGKSEVDLELIILHNNDMHARFEQTSVNSGKCTEAEANSNKCYGGFARVAHEIRKYREEAKNGGPPVLYLNAGDTYTGTPWFTVFKDNITAAFLNKLHPDAISLGNHEFDENVAGLLPFLNEVDFPVLTCNLDLSKAPEIGKTRSFRNSTVLLVNNHKIGVIGYLTPDTKLLVATNEVEFKPEIESINAEAAQMKREGINIIIALGHSGYQKDQEIAAQCPDVDIVIGGHSHSFLYSGNQPSVEKSEGPYPTVVKQKSGKEVPVVQAYAYTKYLGKLHVQFDKNGKLIEFDGTPILLNASVPSDSDVLQLLEVYRPNITALENSVVGHTKVHLEGHSSVCRKGECNLGNLIADSMIYARVIEDQGGLYWTDAPIAFVQGGGIRSSIDKSSDGVITGSDIKTVLPYGNDLVITKITGLMILDALEHSATIRDRDSNGGFLQMSGVHVTYDLRQEEGKRVVSAEVRCGSCAVPTFERLNNTKVYNVIVPDFLYKGGDGHVFKDNSTASETITMTRNDEEALVVYLQQREFVYPEVDGRLIVIEKPKDGSATSITSSIMAILSALFILKIFN